MDAGLNAVLFDFDGVLCRGRFYEPRISSSYPAAKEWLQKNIFVSGNETLRKWMRGQLSFRDVHAYLETETGIAAEEFDTLMSESLSHFVMDATLMKWAMRLRSAGLRTAIVTDNMDVFTRFVAPLHKLDRIFDTVVNSADHGCLKNDEKSLFYVALDRLGIAADQALHIDDTERTAEFFRSLGGKAYHFTAESAFGLDRRLSKMLASWSNDQDLFRLHHDEFQRDALRRNDE